MQPVRCAGGPTNSHSLLLLLKLSNCRVIVELLTYSLERSSNPLVREHSSPGVRSNSKERLAEMLGKQRKKKKRREGRGGGGERATDGHTAPVDFFFFFFFRFFFSFFFLW